MTFVCLQHIVTLFVYSWLWILFIFTTNCDFLQLIVTFVQSWLRLCLFVYSWFDIGCVILRDPVNQIHLDVYTQATPVAADLIQQMSASTPAEYDLRWSGFAMTIGQVVSSRLPTVHHSEWHRAVIGLPRTDLLLQAAKSLAHLYRNRRGGGNSNWGLGLPTETWDFQLWCGISDGGPGSQIETWDLKLWCRICNWGPGFLFET